MTGRGQLLAHGRTSEVYAWGSDSVVKVPRPGVPPHWPGVEASITDAVHRAGLPSPEVRGLVDVDGREAIVFQRIHGPSLWDLIVEDPSAIDRQVAILVELQCSIQAVVAPPSVPKLADRLGSKILAADGLSNAERTEAATIMASLPCGSALCHGDLHPANVLLSRDGPVGIDWFDAVVGPATADIARTSLLIRPPTNGRGLTHLPGAPAQVLENLHTSYVAQTLAAATEGLDPPGARCLVDELLAWERVLAAGRLAEHTTADRADLLALWHSNGGDEASALARSVGVSAGGDERCQPTVEAGRRDQDEVIG